MSHDDLVAAATQARENAYSPYSRFRVGAALLTRSGKIFTGCNVENISLGLTICAERNAVGAAIASGEKDFLAITIVADFDEPVLPCGACRQVLAEFNPKIEIITSTIEGRREIGLLSALLPGSGQKILGGTQNV